MASGVTVAVVGVTGAVGQTTLKILEERKFPVKALRAFASERSVGKTVTFKGETIRVEKVGPESFKGVEVAFFSAGSAQAREYAPQAVKAGAVVVDKSSAFRMDPKVPLVVPEINAHALKGTRASSRAPTARRSSPSCRSSRSTTPGASARDRHELPGRLRCGRQRRRGAAEQTLAWARGEAMTPKYLPAPDRLQRHPPHRQVRRGRLHGGGDEAGQRGPEDSRAARPARSRPRRCACRSSPRTRSRSTPRPRW